MFKIGDRCTPKNAERGWRQTGTNIPFPGPNTGDILDVSEVVPVEKEIGLQFIQFRGLYPFDSKDFEKLISDSELNEYRDKVSKVELDHFQIDKINII